MIIYVTVLDANVPEAQAPEHPAVEDYIRVAHPSPPTGHRLRVVEASPVILYIDNNGSLLYPQLMVISGF